MAADPKGADGEAGHSVSAAALSGTPAVKRRVAYLYHPDVGNFHYGPGHPMKPHRIAIADAMVRAYGLYEHMDVYVPHIATVGELQYYHDDDYVNFVHAVSSSTVEGRMRVQKSAENQRLYKVEAGSDCPPFAGVFKFQSICAGGSIDAAKLLASGSCDVAINWAGGMHHARRCEASGFCYFNDIVLGILELLKTFKRVLYIDIDIHHGDGVEEAFYLSHRVMTLSFHKFGDFFPGTGDITDVGAGAGKYYAVNVPLLDGIGDRAFFNVFHPIVNCCVEVFQPEAIVLQCGADSLTGDRLGDFNLSTRGHGACVEYVRSLRIPLMLVGGGGYTLKNVARVWTHETGVAVGRALDDSLPNTEYLGYFGPEGRLHIYSSPKYIDRNDSVYLEVIKQAVMANVRKLEHAPSIQFSHLPAPYLHHDRPWDDEDVDAYHDVVWEGAEPGGLPRILETAEATTTATTGPMLTELSAELPPGLSALEVVTPASAVLEATQPERESSASPSVIVSSSQLQSPAEIAASFPELDARLAARPQLKGPSSDRRPYEDKPSPIGRGMPLSAISPPPLLAVAPSRPATADSNQPPHHPPRAGSVDFMESDTPYLTSAEQRRFSAPAGLSPIRTARLQRPTSSAAVPADQAARSPVQSRPPPATLGRQPGLASMAPLTGSSGLTPEGIHLAAALQPSLDFWKSAPLSQALLSVLATTGGLSHFPPVGPTSIPTAEQQRPSRASLPAMRPPFPGITLSALAHPAPVLDKVPSGPVPLKASLGPEFPKLIGLSSSATRPPHWGAGYPGATSPSSSSAAPLKTQHRGTQAFQPAKPTAAQPTASAPPRPTGIQQAIAPSATRPRSSLPAAPTALPVGAFRRLDIPAPAAARLPPPSASAETAPMTDGTAALDRPDKAYPSAHESANAHPPNSEPNGIREPPS